MGAPNLAALQSLIAGKKPGSKRTFSPESVRRATFAKSIADVTEDEVIVPLREWIDTLKELVEAVDTALENVEENNSELRDAEDADDREDAYGSLDASFSELADALYTLDAEA